MKIKFCSMAALLLALPILFLTAEAEDAEEIPYPPRDFLYVVDCSGSMREYEEALNVARIMLRDLLPANTTTVVAFNGSASVVTDTLSFGGETSVLAGLEEADRILEQRWQDMQESGTKRETTILLFSDMQSTVISEDGRTPLTDASFQVENDRLQAIEALWSQHILERDLRFYSLCWPAGESDTYMVAFDPSWKNASSSHHFELDSAQEILKTCVEAYACVLTGSDEFQWTETEGQYADGTLHIPVEESYRTFLYLSQVPSGVADPSGRNITPKNWHLSSGGCILMLENTKQGTYNLQGRAESYFSLTIPQPQLTVRVLPGSAVCYEEITISVAMSAGDSYLGYDTSNSQCLMEIRPLQEGAPPQPVASTYNKERNCYEFVYTPKSQGNHEVSILYLILGDEVINMNRLETLEVRPYEIKLTGNSRREYEDLRQYLQTKLQVGDEFSFSLSDYFKSPYQRLEFIVDAPEKPESLYWEASSSAEGRVTIQALQADSVNLCYSIAYYEGSATEPEHTQSLELSIQVYETTSDHPLLALILAVIGLASFVLFGLILCRRKS